MKPIGRALGSDHRGRERVAALSVRTARNRRTRTRMSGGGGGGGRNPPAAPIGLLLLPLGWQGVNGCLLEVEFLVGKVQGDQMPRQEPQAKQIGVFTLADCEFRVVSAAPNAFRQVNPAGTIRARVHAAIGRISAIYEGICGWKLARRDRGIGSDFSDQAVVKNEGASLTREYNRIGFAQLLGLKALRVQETPFPGLEIP